MSLVQKYAPKIKGDVLEMHANGTMHGRWKKYFPSQLYVIADSPKPSEGFYFDVRSTYLKSRFCQSRPHFYGLRVLRNLPSWQYDMVICAGALDDHNDPKLAAAAIEQDLLTPGGWIYLIRNYTKGEVLFENIKWLEAELFLPEIGDVVPLGEEGDQKAILCAIGHLTT